MKGRDKDRYCCKKSKEHTSHISLPVLFSARPFFRATSDRLRSR